MRSEWRREETLSLSVEELQHLKAEKEDGLAKHTKQEGWKESQGKVVALKLI